MLLLLVKVAIIESQTNIFAHKKMSHNQNSTDSNVGKDPIKKVIENYIYATVKKTS